MLVLVDGKGKGISVLLSGCQIKQNIRHGYMSVAATERSLRTLAGSGRRKIIEF